MQQTSPASVYDPQPFDPALVEQATELVRRWLTDSADEPVDAAAKRLAGVLKDPNGLDFTVGFVDGVVRPEDHRVAAHALHDLTGITPKFLPLPLRTLVKLGGALAPALPAVVVPIARRVLRHMVRHLVVDATDSRLGPAIERITGGGEGIRLNINLLGEAILGQSEAAKRLEGTTRLLSRDDVDYVSIKVSSTVAPHNPWSFAEAVDDAVTALEPLYRIAAAAGTGQGQSAGTQAKFINLDMEEYKDLDLTLAVFTQILERPEFHNLEAGIVLQAYLPDALSAMIRLQEWAARRVANGGAPIKVRVVKGANLPMETTDAEIHGWPLATWHTKRESDSSYKAVLDYSLRPEHIQNVRIGVAGHNLFDIALAWLVAQQRGVTDGIDFEMLLGMATQQAAVVRRDVGSLLLYTPVVHPAEFDVAIAYLIRRLEEGASSENFMSAVFDLNTNEKLFNREKERFLASIADALPDVPKPHRIQDRTSDPEPWAERDLASGVFENTPDTDTSISVNRQWGAAIRQQMQTSRLGIDTVESHTVSTSQALDAELETAVAAGQAWRELGADARAEILHRAGDMLERRRAHLLEVMGSECGKLLDQGDPEVSEAVDFAHYYAERGRDLVNVEGATAVPARLTVVTPPWNFPVAIPAGSTLAALASGSPVVIKPAPQAARSGAVMIEALWDAGVPRDVLRFVQVDEGDLGRQLISDPRVDRLILTGAYETAELFRSFRPDLPLLAETSGKNAIIVTPSADLDLAAKDVAYSAFGHAGQKCSAASLVILVGAAATSKRFARQLVDAVTSLHVGYPWQESAQVGPIVEPAGGKLLRALTTLEEGQRWIVRPQQLDSEGKLWKPGIRGNVARGSEFHLTEYFGPVMGVMAAETLDEAIDMVNEIDYGLTSGLHSLDTEEVQHWLSRIQAGNVYANRGITGAIVQRQPFGGWKKSAVGAGTKAGGPNYLMGLVDWEDDGALDDAASQVGHLGGDLAADPISRGALAALRQAMGNGSAPRKPEQAESVLQSVAAAAPAPGDAAPGDAAVENATPAGAASTADAPHPDASRPDISGAGVASPARTLPLGQPKLEEAWLLQALASDKQTMTERFGRVSDPTGLTREVNALRYHPTGVTIRVESSPLVHLIRVLAAAIRVKAPVTVSTREALPVDLVRYAQANGIDVVTEGGAAWVNRAAALSVKGGRIRYLGENALDVYAATEGSPAVAIYSQSPVLAGRVELLPFIREQAASITAHRFGTERDYTVPAVI